MLEVEVHGIIFDYEDYKDFFTDEIGWKDLIGFFEDLISYEENKELKKRFEKYQDCLSKNDFKSLEECSSSIQRELHKIDGLLDNLKYCKENEPNYEEYWEVVNDFKEELVSYYYRDIVDYIKDSGMWR